jgi:hypothetical protein
VVYTHYYEFRIEIIIQNGRVTKANGIESVIRFLKDMYEFKRVILFAHGNSSNDLPMIQRAYKMKNKDKDSLGESFWVGVQSDIAGFCFKDVNTLQKGVIGLAEYVKSLDE